MISQSSSIITCETLRIMEHLTHGGLDTWIMPCYTILIHYYGLESAIENPQDEPAIAIVESVRTSIRAKPYRRLSCVNDYAIYR